MEGSIQKFLISLSSSLVVVDYVVPIVSDASSDAHSHFPYI